MSAHAPVLIAAALCLSGGLACRQDSKQFEQPPSTQDVETKELIRAELRVLGMT